MADTEETLKELETSTDEELPWPGELVSTPVEGEVPEAVEGEVPEAVEGEVPDLAETPMPGVPLSQDLVDFLKRTGLELTGEIIDDGKVPLAGGSGFAVDTTPQARAARDGVKDKEYFYGE